MNTGIGIWSPRGRNALARKGYGINLVCTVQFNRALKQPDGSIPIRLKSLVVNNQTREKAIRKVMNRMRVLGNLKRNRDAVNSSNYESSTKSTTIRTNHI